MKRKFRTANLENFYNYMLEHPPLYRNGSRRHGSALNNEFWNGYDGIKNNHQLPTSFGEAAYWAGQDYRKNDSKK